MGPEVVKAMPRAEAIRLIVCLVLAGVGLGVFLAYFFPAWMKAYLYGHDRSETLLRFMHLMLGFAASFLPLIFYLIGWAMRIIKSRQMPYPGQKVFRDTIVVRGRRALAHGWALMFIALLFLACAVLAVFTPILLFPGR